VIPNLNDLGRREFASPMAVPPTAPIDEILGTIAASDLVVGSSLHAIVVAESFGIPARLVRSGAEPTLKYDDYYRGSGRVRYRVAQTVDEAVRMGGETPPVWDCDALLAAFPRDLWSPPC
jgi:pyruvyltransferase